MGISHCYQLTWYGEIECLHFMLPPERVCAGADGLLACLLNLLFENMEVQPGNASSAQGFLSAWST